MNKPIVVFFGLLALLWTLLGSFLSGRHCNCAKKATVPAVVAPLTSSDDKIAKSILIVDGEKNFKAATNDNLLFQVSSCDYFTPLSDPLTEVYKQTVNHLKAHPQRLLVLTGLYQGNENNSCQGSKDLGYGRAEKVRQLLVEMGAPASQIRVQSDKKDLTLFDGKILGGVLYEFISGEATKVEERLRMGNITLHFDSNEKEVSLTLDQQKYFEDLKYFLTQKPSAKISVTGHTDNRSNLKYNMRLSRKRAEFVRDFMVQNGIPSNNIVIEAKGPNEPVATNDTEEGRAANRRVEVKIQ